MTVWDELIGGGEAIAALRSAAEHPDDPSSMSHAWLITGPAGSGRSNLAVSFAQALLCEERVGCGVCKSCVLSKAGTHPDLSVLRTEKVIISIDDVRSLVSQAQLSPAVSSYRVQIIEDADRMAERTSNVLLKSLEEPPAGTIWILCAPSEVDLLPTIRSRTRSIRLSTPSHEQVASLLVRRDGVDPELALNAAREAQSHIGMARRLATDPEARQRRVEALSLVISIRSVSEAVLAASALIELAKADTLASQQEQNDREKAEYFRQFGLSENDPIPPAYRAQFRTLTEDQKRRSTRSMRDGLDRILTDVMTLMRDVLLLGLGEDTGLINEGLRADLQRYADQVSPTRALANLDAITVARDRISANVSPLLALEAMLVSFVAEGSSVR